MPRRPPSPVLGGRIVPVEAIGGAAIGAVTMGAAIGAATVGNGVGAAAGWQFSVNWLVRVILPTTAVIVAVTGIRLVLVLGAVKVAEPLLLLSTIDGGLMI